MLSIRFTLLVLLYLIVNFAIETTLVSDDLVYEFLIGQLSYDRITKMLDEGKNLSWVSYFIFPLTLLLKFFLITICLSVGGLFIGLENSSKRFFSAIVNTDFVVIAPLMTKLLWFNFYQTDYSLKGLQYFSPFSALSLFNPNEVEPWLAYPLQVLNVFEFIYWLALAYQLKEVLGKSFTGSLGFVTSTYGVGLLIWVVLVMFLTVSVS